MLAPQRLLQEGGRDSCSNASRPPVELSWREVYDPDAGFALAEKARTLDER
jgi:hypothetical protein